MEMLLTVAGATHLTFILKDPLGKIIFCVFPDLQSATRLIEKFSEQNQASLYAHAERHKLRVTSNDTVFVYDGALACRLYDLLQAANEYVSAHNIDIHRLVLPKEHIHLMMMPLEGEQKYQEIIGFTDGDGVTRLCVFSPTQEERNNIDSESALFFPNELGVAICAAAHIVQTLSSTPIFN